MKKTILITRPKDQAQNIVHHLENNGFEVFVEPTFSVQKINPRMSFEIQNIVGKKIQAIILTSGNAAEVAFGAADILKFDKNIKIFAVGKKTAEIFLANGFNNVQFAERNSAEDLKSLILSDEQLMSKKNGGSLLYFCGEFITLDFKEELERYGVEVEKIVSYKILEEKNFSEQFLERVQEQAFDFVLLYSKNSAKHFCNLCKKHNLLEYFHGSQILCLSDKIVSVLRITGFRNIATFDAIPILKKFYD